MTDRIAIRRLSISAGVDQRGQTIAVQHVATTNKKLFVVPGKYASIEITGSDGKVTVGEVPLGQLGWEYEILG